MYFFWSYLLLCRHVFDFIGLYTTLILYTMIQLSGPYCLLGIHICVSNRCINRRTQSCKVFLRLLVDSIQLFYTIFLVLFIYFFIIDNVFVSVFTIVREEINLVLQIYTFSDTIGTFSEVFSGLKYLLNFFNSLLLSNMSISQPFENFSFKYFQLFGLLFSFINDFSFFNDLFVFHFPLAF
jgi:hypothetical protein